MKNVIRQLVLVLVILSLVAVCFVACDDDITPCDKHVDANGDQICDVCEEEVVEDGNDGDDTPVIGSLVLTASSTTASRGDIITLEAMLKVGDKQEQVTEDVEFSFVQGADSATLVGNTLKISNTANHGALIKVKAHEGATDSNIVEIIVSVPATNVTISANGSTNLLAGSSTVLTHTITPAGADNNISFEITEGQDVATLSGNVLVVGATATTGKTIKVKATVGTVTSNELTFTVGYPLETITVASATTNIKSGEMAQLGVTITPANATNADYTWTFVEGADLAIIVNNVITVKSTAPTGAVIKVKAVAGDVESNVVEFTVGYPLETITVASATTNIKSGEMAQLGVTITPTNATNANYTWTFVEGADLATITGDVITVKADAPTGAVIKVKAVAGSIESNVVSFIVGYPLESLTASLVGSSSNIKNGGYADLSVSLNPTNATNGQYVWEFVAGEEFASISNNRISINEDAPVGSIIKIVAVAGQVRSNEIFIMVGTPVETITISTEAPEVLDREVKYTFPLVDVTPAGASVETIIWVVEGVDSKNVTIEGNTISFGKNTPAGSAVKIYAASGSVVSNSFEFVVGVALESIEITLDGSANIEPGTSRLVDFALNPANASDTEITWVIDNGNGFARINGGMIFVNADAPIGAQVTFHAEIGDVKSNSITITVGVVLEKIEISLAGSVNVDPDASRTINAEFTPSNASLKNITWVIDNGREYATISGGIITVNENAPIGATVTFHGEIGDVKSNELTIIVGTPIESITISAASDKVVKGNSVALSATVAPAKANASLIGWVITAGEEYATITGSTLTIKEGSPTGEIVKIKAVYNSEFVNVESNELEFTIMPTQEEINASKLFIDAETNFLTIDKKGATTPSLSAEILNGNYDVVTNLGLEFTVIEGEELLALNPNGYSCSFTALGHGEATVQIRIEGTDITENVRVQVIVPPESIVLPEVFVDRPGFEYNFSKVNPLNNAVEALPFMPTVRGAALACQDLKYSFTHESGKTGDEVAIYDGSSIIFKKTGKVTVTITSDSGSRLEAIAAYTFNINEGYNVYSFEHFSFIVESDFYTGSLPINLVVLEKPVAQYETSYVYGYDLVPELALEDPSLQTVQRMVRAYTTYNGRNVNARIQAVNKGLWVNGNKHKIDVSQLRIFTYKEYNTYATVYMESIGQPHIPIDNYMPNLSSLLSAETWFEGGVNDPAHLAIKDKKVSYQVKLYDLELRGSAGFNYNPATYNEGTAFGAFVGTYGEGLSIGNFEYDTHYYIDANNLTASGFRTCLKFTNIVGNGKIKNLHVYDCYGTGVNTRSSIVTLENIKIGLCGATGMELGPEDANQAGLGNNELSTVTIQGTVDASTNLNNGESHYFNNYDVMGTPVKTIIIGNTTSDLYNDNQVAHIMNSQGQFIFVSLLFNDLREFPNIKENQSVVEYPAYQKGGIINLKDLPKSGFDTTHQFIKMDIMVEIPGVGDKHVGTAYFYNHYYGKTV